MKHSELNILYNLHAKQLYYYALGMTNCSDTSQEIVQDAYVKIWNAVGEVKNQYSFLRSTVRNACMNYIRDKAVEDKRIQEYLDIDNDDDFREAVKDIVEKIKSIMETLPPKCKEIFILKYMHGMKYREIAEDLDISQHTVKSQLRYATDKIKDKIPKSELGLFILIINLL